MYSQFTIGPKSPYLALLGDIGNVYDDRLFQFLEQQLEQFDIVFYVFGNHEPYQVDPETSRCTYEGAISKMEAFDSSVKERREENSSTYGTAGQFIFLNRTRFDLSATTTILGCTLFSNITPSQHSTASLFVSDFSNIEDWTVDTHNAAHRRDLEWLNNQVSTITQVEPHRKLVILTHHSPTNLSEANDPEHLEDPRGLQTAFVTDLANEPCWGSPSVKVWAFGHTHYNCDFVDSGTGKRVVANQRGYGREDAFDFDAEKVVTIH